jgi:hypothetical protein
MGEDEVSPNREGLGQLPASGGVSRSVAVPGASMHPR